MHQLKSNCCSVDQCQFSVFTPIQQEELMRWHPGGVIRTKIRGVDVNFSEYFIKGKETELVRDNGELELSEFELTE